MEGEYKGRLQVNEKQWENLRSGGGAEWGERKKGRGGGGIMEAIFSLLLTSLKKLE